MFLIYLFTYNWSEAHSFFVYLILLFILRHMQATIGLQANIKLKLCSTSLPTAVVVDRELFKEKDSNIRSHEKCTKGQNDM